MNLDYELTTMDLFKGGYSMGFKDGFSMGMLLFLIVYIASFIITLCVFIL